MAASRDLRQRQSDLYPPGSFRSDQVKLANVESYFYHQDQTPQLLFQGGSDQLWETRIPDPPEGFEEEVLKASTKPSTTHSSTTELEDRIPITTPTGTTRLPT